MKKEETTEEGTANPEIADSIDYMALVNKTHPLPDGWEDKLETAHMTNSVGDDVEVEKKAYDAYLKLKAIGGYEMRAIHFGGLVKSAGAMVPNLIKRQMIGKTFLVLCLLFLF